MSPEPTIEQLHAKLADLEGQLGGDLRGIRAYITAKPNQARCIDHVLDVLLDAVKQYGPGAVIAYAMAETADLLPA